VSLHRSGGLRALTAEAHDELTDVLDVAAVLANQNDAFRHFVDCVHDSSLTTNHPARCVRQHSPVTLVLNLDEALNKNRRADTCT
jgi:hypothetical protein